MSDNYNFNNVQQPQNLVEPQPVDLPPQQYQPTDQQFQTAQQFQPVQPQPIIPEQTYNPPPPTNFNPNSLVNNSEPEKNKLDIRKFLPYIIIGIVGIIVLIFVINLLFSNNSGNQNNTSSEKVVLQWWGAFMDPSEVQPLLDEYNTENPNVTIEYANKIPADTASDDAALTYKTELDRILKANDPVQIPDIFSVSSTWAGDYERYVKSSTSYDSETFNNTFYEVVGQDFAHNGTINGVPLWLDTLAVVYNKDILASKAVLNVPTDWPSFKSLAQNLTTKEKNTIKVAGFAGGLSSNVSYSFDVLNVLLFQNGVSVTDSKDVPTFAEDTDSVSAFQFYKDFANSSTGTWSRDIKNDSAAFLEGNVAMIIVPSYRLREILYYNEQYGLNLNIGVAQLPQLQGQDQAVINWPEYWGNMVALNRPNSTEAWKFLQWITQSDKLKELSDNIKTNEGYFGILYPRKDMATELSDDQYLKIYNDSLPNLKTWYMVKGMDIKEAFNKVIEGNSVSQGQLTTLETNVKTLISNKGVL